MASFSSFDHLTTSTGDPVTVLRVLVFGRGASEEANAEVVWSFEYHAARPLWDANGLLADAMALWAQLRSDVERHRATRAVIRACAENSPPSGHQGEEYYDVVYGLPRAESADGRPTWRVESHGKWPPPVSST